MPVLNFDTPPRRSRLPKIFRTKKAIFFAVAALVVAGVGTTLAGQIFIGNTPSGDSVTFGQGVASTLACDPTINLAPKSQYLPGPIATSAPQVPNPTATTNVFKFTGLTISGVSSDCMNKLFTIKAYDSAGNVLPFPSDPYATYFSFYFDPTGWYSAAESCMNFISPVVDSSTSNSVTIDWSECAQQQWVALSSDLAHLTIEQSENPYGRLHYGTSYFEYVDSGVTWQEAYDAVETRNPDGTCAYTLGNLCGYLATVTSAGERTYINSQVATSDVWLGGSDRETEGLWRWVSGPDVGKVFLDARACGQGLKGNCTAGSADSTVNYNNWNDGEPNNSNGSENYLQMIGGSGGLWNDLNGSQRMGYVVKYTPGYLSQATAVKH